MHGATVNYYTGLGEFDDMGFLLHFLRANDFFLDVGANVGAYSVLAGAVVGCRGIAFEPDAKAFDRLRINLALNHADRRIEGRRQVVGRTAGRVKFTSGLDSLNHVLAEGESVGGRVEEIEAINLDGISWERKPCLVKIDTEGFEPEVLAGGKSFFSDPAIRAIIIEIEHSPRYGVSLDTLFHDVCRRGFVPVRYRPLKRQIEAQAAPLRFDPAAPTSLFVRDPEEAQKRCETARAVRILGKDV